MKIVVSGASSGIGKEICKFLLSKGHQVLALARRENLLKEFENDSSYAYLAVDLSVILPETGRIGSIDKPLNDTSPRYSKLKKAIADFGHVDILINNAGGLINLPFNKTASAQFVDQYKANVITAVNLIHACDPYLKDGSHVVNISSMGGFQGSSKYPGLAAYSAAKGALSILSECLAEEYKDKGVHVNALALGAVQTDMLKAAFPDVNGGASSAEMAKYISNFALSSGRLINGKVIPVALGNP